MLRKPVVLITGASGEIGHGLITSLAAERRAPHHHARRQGCSSPSSVPLVHQEFIGSILDAGPARARSSAEYEVDLVFHLAALLSTRSEFTPMTAHRVNVEGTMHLLEFAQRQGESHGRPVVFLYPSSIAAYGLPDLGTKDARRPRDRGRVQHADHDVRLQQAVLRAPGALLRQALQAARPRDAVRQGRLPRPPLPRPDLGDHRAVRRHLRLRPRDDPRRRAGQAVRLLRAPGHAHPLHGDARRGRRRCCASPPHPTPRLTRTVYNVGAFNPSADEIRRHRAQGLPRRRRSPTRSTSSARASSTPGRPTSTTRRPATTGATHPSTTSTGPSASTSSRPSASATGSTGRHRHRADPNLDLDLDLDLVPGRRRPPATPSGASWLVPGPSPAAKVIAVQVQV